jgi:hypothetical protein
LPVRNVLVVLPQPPFGERVATMLVRETPGKVRLLTLARGEEQRAQPIAKTRERGVRGTPSVDDRRVVEVVATNANRLGRRALRRRSRTGRSR